MFDDMVDTYQLDITPEEVTIVKALIAGEQDRCSCVLVSFSCSGLDVLMRRQARKDDAVLVRDRGEPAEWTRRGQVSFLRGGASLRP